MSAASRAYATLKKRITTGELQPAQPLTEESVAEELQVSRTPLRQAIQRLATEGFVEVFPRKGAFVARISAGDVLEILVIREALEGIAARIAAETIPAAELDAMTALLDGLAAQNTQCPLTAAGDEIHDLILTHCRVGRMRQILKTYEEQLTWFHNIARRLPGRLERSLYEHQAILAALRARNGDLAERLMRQHIRGTREEVERHFVTTDL